MANKVKGFGPLHTSYKKSTMAKAIQKGLNQAATKLVHQYQAITPVRTGYLRSRWQTGMQSESLATVYNDAIYAQKVMGSRLGGYSNVSQLKGNIEIQISAAITKAFT
jgi:hypothetical protein